MMCQTHEAFAGAWWLGGTLAVDYLAVASGHTAPVHGLSVILGVSVCAAFAGGKNSPDIDHVFWPGPPRGYRWNGHRGITHRVWFVAVLTWLTWLAAAALFHRVDVPHELRPLIYAPVAGWWSHLAGDMIYGKIRIAGKARGLGWETGGIAENGVRWFRDPASRLFTVMAFAFIGGHLALLAGLA